jgi:putative glutamine amidotransferase
MRHLDHPAIGIPCCVREIGGHVFHGVGEKYIVAAVDSCGGLPILIPAFGDRFAPEAWLGRIDGLLITGSRSNVEPRHYGRGPSRPGTLHDPQRDALTLPLIRAAIAADLPVLAICRGIQELNVALGGTLHEHVHEVPGRLDHRAPDEELLERRYAHDRHEVRLIAGGLLRGLAGAEAVTVNSLHSQGIDDLAPGLAVEAVAPDGQIEAVRVAGAGFVVGVQWHPEFPRPQNAFSRALFEAFARACKARAASVSGTRTAAE